MDKKSAPIGRRESIVVATLAVALVTAFCVVVLSEFDYTGARDSRPNLWIGVAEEVGAANVVSSIYLGARLFDTLLEVLVFAVAALGVRFYLTARGRPEPVESIPESHVVRVAVDVLLPPILLLGIYVVAHGHLSPGGGFSGGVIAASALLFAAIALGTERVSARLRPDVLRWTEWGVLVGVLALGVFPAVRAMPLLSDPLPAGRMGALASGGSLLLYNSLIGTKVFIASWIIVKHFVDHRGEI
jgi:multicomponent Na+:H+ antiporter subunit B